MPRIRSLVTNVQIDIVQRAHDCQGNGNHKLTKGNRRLAVRKDRGWDNYCLECGKRILEARRGPRSRRYCKPLAAAARLRRTATSRLVLVEPHLATLKLPASRGFPCRGRPEWSRLSRRPPGWKPDSRSGHGS